MLRNPFGKLFKQSKTKPTTSDIEEGYSGDGSPYSPVGSADYAVPKDLVGREYEAHVLINNIEDTGSRVAFLHGEIRIGKSYLLSLVANQWLKSGRPFLYHCPSERDIGDFFEKIGTFAQANGFSEFSEEINKPELNDDDKIGLVVDLLKEDRFLIILDDFDKVEDRRTFTELVQSIGINKPKKDENDQVVDDRELAGRVLVCSRSLPSLHERLPKSHRVDLFLQGFDLGDTKEIIQLRGFDGSELAGMESDFRIHPFALELLLYLAQKKDTSLKALISNTNKGDLGGYFLEIIYEEMDGANRRLIDSISVLRTTFPLSTIEVFSSGELKAEVAESLPLKLFFEYQKDTGTYKIHPIIKSFGNDHRKNDPSLFEFAHSKAIIRYEPGLAGEGKSAAISEIETGYHLYELGEFRKSLEVLSSHCRRIISFGYGSELYRLTFLIDESGVREDDQFSDKIIAQILREISTIYVYLPGLGVTDNHLRAIRYCGRAIELISEDEEPIERAQTLNVLGMACSRLPIGDPRKNVNKAFDHYRESLVIFQNFELLGGCAMLHNNMGTAYIRLSEYGGESHLRLSLGHLKQAAALCEEIVDPFTQAEIESNLGYVYCLIGKSDEGMKYFQKAMEILTKDHYPLEYAQIQQQMGDAHRLLTSGLRKSRLDTSIRYYAEALKTFEEGVFPVGFAQCQHTLAISFNQLSLYEDRKPFLQKSAKCYQNALRVYREDLFPRQYSLVNSTLDKVEQVLEEFTRSLN